MLGHVRPKPWICTEPRRMHKMVKSHDGLQPILAAIHQHINVAVQSLIIERRGRPHPINVSRLHSAPFDPETERVETELPATCEILRITIPKVGTETGRRD